MVPEEYMSVQVRAPSNFPVSSFRRDTKVLELGAGMAGIAGLCISKTYPAASVYLTDANPEAVANLRYAPVF